MTTETAAPPLTESLEHCIRNRHSIRMYKPEAVPESILRECLTLAQLAPSNSNMQNWRVTLAQGPARERVVAALSHAATQGPPQVPPLPPKFSSFRSEFGHTLYGEAGYNIPRGDKEHLKSAQLRNFSFFEAPVCGVISMDESLSHVDSMSVGLFVQTFMLAMTERGLGSCLEVSVTGYPDILRREFDLKPEQMVLCGIAIGWPADHPVNTLHVQRESLDNEVRFLTE